MSEHDEQVSFFQALALNYNRLPQLKWVHAIPNGGHRGLKVARKMKAEGVKTGVSDVFIPIPVNKFHGCYIELKFGYNKLTADQQEFAAFVRKQGYMFYSVWSAKDAMMAVEDYLEVRLIGGSRNERTR